jgi:hypothetical protein
MQSLEDNFDMRYTNDSKKDLDDNVKQSMLLLKEADIQAQFNDYYYDGTLPQYKAEATQARSTNPALSADHNTVSADDVKVSA